MRPWERATPIGYLPAGQPKAAPIRVVAVLLELSTGEMMRYVVSPPAKLDGSPKRADFIAGRAYIGRL